MRQEIRAINHSILRTTTAADGLNSESWVGMVDWYDEVADDALTEKALSWRDI